MLVAFNSSIANLRTKKPAANATGFRSWRPAIGASNRDQTKPVKHYEHLTDAGTGYFMSEATAFAKATGSSRGMPSTSSAWL